jgi:hypothetical protein
LSRRFFECSGRRNASQIGIAREQSILNRQTRKLSTSPSKRANCLRTTTKLCSPSTHHTCPPFPTRSFRAFTQSTRARNTTSPEAGDRTNAHSQDSGKHGDETKSRKTFFPDASSNMVAYWLLGSAASVFGIVVFGGLTRLTESGFVYPILVVFLRHTELADPSQQPEHHRMETSHRLSTAHV